MSVRLVLFKHEPSGSKSIEDIAEFDQNTLFLKSGKLSALVSNYLTKWIRKVNSGEIYKTPVWTIAVEHIDK